MFLVASAEASSCGFTCATMPIISSKPVLFANNHYAAAQTRDWLYVVSCLSADHDTGPWWYVLPEHWSAKFFISKKK